MPTARVQQLTPPARGDADRLEMIKPQTLINPGNECCGLGADR
jgi:hypothetical protein